MNREELIEEAAKAMVAASGDETWEDCDQAWYLAHARVAFAMFEKAQCKRCGKLAEGYAFIGDDRYCHPDDGVDCYTLANHGL